MGLCNFIDDATRIRGGCAGIAKCLEVASVLAFAFSSSRASAIPVSLTSRCILKLPHLRFWPPLSNHVRTFAKGSAYFRAPLGDVVERQAEFRLRKGPGNARAPPHEGAHLNARQWPKSQRGDPTILSTTRQIDGSYAGIAKYA